jgi:hypothetical protein
MTTCAAPFARPLRAPATACHPGASARLGRRLAFLAGCATLAAGAPAIADPLATPSLSGPLADNPHPISFDGGLLGPVYVSGQVSGLGLVQSHATPAPGTGNAGALLDLSNAQIEIQTTSGPVQFYLQAGAYSLPSLGTSYLRADKTSDQLYGSLPVAYAKVVLSPDLSVMAGALPTLIGAESTFTFQNMNIERGLLWSQEPAISKGVQVNYSRGPFQASVSVNDGYDSDRLNWVSGLVSYTFNPSNSVSIVGGGNVSSTEKSTVATPLVQNNSRIFNVIYTYSSGKLALTPYLQYSQVDSNPNLGIDRSATSYGGAVLGKYAINDEVSIAARAEYIKSDGGGCGADVDCAPTNLLYGAGSKAWSLTVTPTYQRGVFFVRGELSYTRIDRMTSGLGFGSSFNEPDQVRGLVETGVLF